MRGGVGYLVGVARVRRIRGDPVPGFRWPQRKPVAGSSTLPGLLRIAGRHGDLHYKGWRTLRGSLGDVPVQEATEPADVEESLSVTVTDRPRSEGVR